MKWPNPKITRVADPDKRKLGCRLTNDCLASLDRASAHISRRPIRTDGDWSRHGMSCMGCEAFQPMTELERQSELHGLVDLACAMAKMPPLRGEPSDVAGRTIWIRELKQLLGID